LLPKFGDASPLSAMKIGPIILASASPRRVELLQQIGIEFAVVPSKSPEKHNEQLTGAELAHINAYHKARAVAKKHPDAIVLGADTLVCLGTRLYGKPETRVEARQMLTELQGQTHQVVTGVCLLHLRQHRQRVFSDSTDVTFRKLDEAEIDHYLTKINPLDKAGAYAIQDHGELIVERIDGSFTNVVGLPLERLKDELMIWASAH
jgi:septum formation protein